MLVTRRERETWIVTQPDHAEVAGYLAAHWGNEEFTRPGGFGDAEDRDGLRAAVVRAIAKHDNGWIEWDADPELSSEHGYPKGLSDVLQDQQAGMNRWRRGLRRRDDAPFENLLVSMHAHWLYAAKVEEHPDPAFLHPLFWRSSPEALLPGRREAALDFLSELESLREEWRAALRSESRTASWLEDDSFLPHVRLLQILDGLSLSLSSLHIPARSGDPVGLGQDDFELRDVPRRSWADRVSIDVRPIAADPTPARSAVIDPYPFDLDPLPVLVPARVFDGPPRSDVDFAPWWSAASPRSIEFRYGSSEDALRRA